MKTFLVLLALIAGCGTYSVPHTGTTTVKSFVMPPEAPRYGSIASGGHVWSWFDAPTYGVFHIENGTQATIDVRLMCVDGFEHELHLSPGKGQRVLVTTTEGRSSNGLCTVSDPL